MVGLDEFSVSLEMVEYREYTSAEPFLYDQIFLQKLQSDTFFFQQLMN